MNQNKLISMFAENEDAFIGALTKSIRTVKYGKEEFEYFISPLELCASLKFLYELHDECDKQEWMELKQLYEILKTEINIDTISFENLEEILMRHIKVLINLLANVQKAKESIELNKLQFKTVQEEL